MSGDDQGRFYWSGLRTKSYVTVLGRSDDVDLVVSNISRRHAMIVDRSGPYFLSDLGSTNGFFLNKEPVETATVMSEGDKVTLGEIVFKFTHQDQDDTEYHSMCATWR